MTRLMSIEWLQVLKTVALARERLGLSSFGREVPDEEWNMAVALTTAYQEITAPKCVTCRQTFTWHSITRCIDCKALLCTNCAAPHFWPRCKPKPSI